MIDYIALILIGAFCIYHIRKFLKEIKKGIYK